MSTGFEAHILEKSTMAVLVVSRTMEIRYANRAARVFFDQDEAIVGMYIDEVAGENGLTFQQLASDALGDEGEVLPHESILATSDGQCRTLLMSATRVGDDIACMFCDLTGLRTAQRQRERTARMLFLERFAAGVASEMNGPLSILKACANGDPHRIQSMDNASLLRDVVRRESSHLSDLLRRLEKFSNPGIPRPESTGINDLVLDVIRNVRSLRGDEEARICFEPDDGAPQVLVDPEQGKRALTDLLLHVMKSLPGGSNITILTRVCDYPSVQGTPSQAVEILIRDAQNGTFDPLSPDFFDPFATPSGKDQPQHDGSLAFVKQFVISHGGQIEVLHEEGIGVTFSLLFPAYLPGAD